jgi:DNA-binding protein HU-beta
MNKSELVQAVSSSSGLAKRQAESAVEAFIDTVMKAVKSGNKVSLTGFGAFNPTLRAAREGRNPQTGAKVRIAASKSVRFSPGSAFKYALNSRGGAKKAAPAKKSGPARKSTTAKKAAKATSTRKR